MMNFTRQGDVRQSLKLGNPHLKHMSQDVIDTIKYLYQHGPNLVLTGSVALALAGKLDRRVHDIDVLFNRIEAPNPLLDGVKVKQDTYDMRAWREKSFSRLFALNGREVKVDFMHHPQSVRYIDVKTADLGGTEVRYVEDLGRIIRMKKVLIEANGTRPEETVKHLLDLKHLCGYDNKQLGEILASAGLYHPTTLDQIWHAVKLACRTIFDILR